MLNEENSNDSWVEKYLETRHEHKRRARALILKCQNQKDYVFSNEFKFLFVIFGSTI